MSLSRLPDSSSTFQLVPSPGILTDHINLISDLDRFCSHLIDDQTKDSFGKQLAKKLWKELTAHRKEFNSVECVQKIALPYMKYLFEYSKIDKASAPLPNLGFSAEVLTMPEFNAENFISIFSLLGIYNNYTRQQIDVILANKKYDPKYQMTACFRPGSESKFTLTVIRNKKILHLKISREYFEGLKGERASFTKVYENMILDPSKTFSVCANWSPLKPMNELLESSSGSSVLYENAESNKLTYENPE